MEQLRIYTLTDKHTAETYFTKHWPKHRESLPKFDVQVTGVWIGKIPEAENQVIAIVSFSDDADIEEVNNRYMKSPEFNDDMAGFDKSKITNVEAKIMSARLT